MRFSQLKRTKYVKYHYLPKKMLLQGERTNVTGYFKLLMKIQSLPISTAVLSNIL